MGLEGRGCEQGTGAHTNGVRVGNEHRDMEDTCGGNQQSISINKIEIE